MKFVYSFWAKPAVDMIGIGYRRPEDFLASWVLSVELTRRHGLPVEFVTDTWGKEIFVDQLQLPFSKVSVSLNSFAAPSWCWAAGKLYAYQQQTEPFIYVASDVFLWQPLPERILQASLCAQCDERMLFKHEYYVIDKLARKLPLLPAELRKGIWDIADSIYNAGILGGNDFGFMRDYAATAIGFISSPKNRATRLFTRLAKDPVYAWKFNTYFDQFLFGCMVKSRGASVECLLKSLSRDDWEEEANKVGYTRLLGRDTKLHAGTCNAVMRVVERDYRNYLPRIDAVAAQLRVRLLPEFTGLRPHLDTPTHTVVEDMGRNGRWNTG